MVLPPLPGARVQHTGAPLTLQGEGRLPPPNWDCSFPNPRALVVQEGGRKEAPGH